MGTLRIAVDSSALIAIAQDEPERAAFVTLIEEAEEAFCSSVTIYEVSVVLMRKKREATSDHALALAELLVCDPCLSSLIRSPSRSTRIAAMAKASAAAHISISGLHFLRTVPQPRCAALLQRRRFLGDGHCRVDVIDGFAEI